MLKQYSDMEKQINKQLDKYTNVQGLMQYINVNSLYKIHEKIRWWKSNWIDKVNKKLYSIDTKEKLRKLIETMKEHKYRPLPVKRAEIPKQNGKTRNEYYKVDYTTSKKKSKLKYKGLLDFIKLNRTTKPKDLIKQLNKKLIGLYNYYGISGNYNWLANIYNFVKQILKKWLSRRSQREKISWSKLDRTIQYNPLVKPKICFQLR